FFKTNGLPSNNVLSLYSDREGVLWVGSSAGLGRFDGKKWTSFSKEEGLLSNRIHYLIEDGAGFLWLGSTAGLMRVQKASLTAYADNPTNEVRLRAYGVADGLPSSECSGGSQPAACLTHDGTLWFPTIAGIGWIDPKSLHANPIPPPVQIEAVRVDGKLQTSLGLRAPLPTHVTIHPGREVLEIDFTSLNLSAPEKGQFSFRLEGYESACTKKPGEVLSVRYSNLPPRHY